MGVQGCAVRATHSDHVLPPVFPRQLELLPESLKASPQVAFPVELEQFLAEGRYNKVLDATRALPDPKFRSFVDPLVDAVRCVVGGPG